jgi:hypothetical protein
MYTSVHWMSSLETEKVQADRSYLLNAKVEMKENDYVRYDRIRFSEVGDRFDPFSIATYNPKNSYLIPSEIGTTKDYGKGSS